MTAKTDNAATQEAMRRRAEEKRSERAAQLPPDRDPLARWRGDQEAILARLQENYGAMWLLGELKLQRYEQRELVGRLIAEAVEHCAEMPDA